MSSWDAAKCWEWICLCQDNRLPLVRNVALDEAPVYHIGDHALNFIRIDVDVMQLQRHVESRYWHSTRLVAGYPRFLE